MLKDLIDWDVVMVQERHAGGHENIMENLFRDAEVIASWVESDYSGEEAFAYRLADGRIVLITDYFGSCSGCDSWDGASDAECRNMCTALANDAHAFDTIEAAVLFIEETVKESPEAYFGERCLEHLLPALKTLMENN